MIMVRWRRVKAEQAVEPGPHSTAGLIVLLRLVADDPDMVEGRLREALRTAASTMEAQDNLVALLMRTRRRFARCFASLTIAWLLLLAFQIANLFHWL